MLVALHRALRYRTSDWCYIRQDSSYRRYDPGRSKVRKTSDTRKWLPVTYYGHLVADCPVVSGQRRTSCRRQRRLSVSEANNHRCVLDWLLYFYTLTD